MELPRQDPDQLLRAIRNDASTKKSGKLKIFFGYAAGVGKTYAMLQAAHQAKERGIDVVAGYIEPHARPQTMALLDGLEQLPVKQVAYEGMALREFDIDAALKRNPQLILVDELAHTNAESSRHTKRYQDVQELLNTGIDVYTTVNVQHIESLNDTVASITGILVRERIPDTFITQNIWGRSWDNDVASLRVFMATLRKKLEPTEESPQYIQTHIGVGYRMIKVN